MVQKVKSSCLGPTNINFVCIKVWKGCRGLEEVIKESCELLKGGWDCAIPITAICIVEATE